MPAQLATILYISSYKEKVSNGYFIGNATGYTRLEENGDGVQVFNITAFYPTDDSKPCYVPNLKEGQVLSVSNSKFTRNDSNEIELILTSATILKILPEELPVHQINVVGVATAIEHPVVNQYGVQIDCIVSDYLSKDRQVEIPITLFHPSGSRFTSQTTTVKRGSIIFFSGTLTLMENKLYLELHNFSFIRTSQSLNSSSSKRMPWALKSSDQKSSNSSISIVKSIHDSKKSAPTPNDSSKSKKSSFSPPALASRFNKTITVPDSDVEYEEKISTPTLQEATPPSSTKRKLPYADRKSKRTSQSKKPTNIAKNLITADLDVESTPPPDNSQTPQEATPPSSTKRKLPYADRKSKRTSQSKKSTNIAKNLITADLDVESTPPPHNSYDSTTTQQEPTSPTTKSSPNCNSKVQKRITRSQKLADIATNIVATADSDVECVEEIE